MGDSGGLRTLPGRGVPADLLWDLMKSSPKIVAMMLKRLAKTVREISPSALAFLYHTV
jgi:hypothetical protein